MKAEFITTYYDTVIVYPERTSYLFQVPYNENGKSYFDTNLVTNNITGLGVDFFIFHQIKGFCEQETVIDIIIHGVNYGTFKERGVFDHNVHPLLIKNNHFIMTAQGFNEHPYMIKVELVGIVSRNALRK